MPDYDKIVLSSHCKQRIHENRSYIKMDWIRKVTLNPDKVKEQGHISRGRIRYEKKMSRYTYVVVVEERKRGKDVYVVTAFRYR